MEYGPFVGTMSNRSRGVLVSMGGGDSVAYAIGQLQERSSFFIEPGIPVYEGMIVGENSRSDDMDINPTKEKKLNNIRSSTAEAFEKLIPPRPLSLEQALELIAEDECVEVTPTSVRLRKVILDQTVRARTAKRAKSLD